MQDRVSGQSLVVAALVQDSSALVQDSSPAGAGARAAAKGARVFLARRSHAAGHGGLWELPGGKVEAGESPEAAIVREIREELGVALTLDGPPSRYEISLASEGGRQRRDFVFLVFPSSFAMLPGEAFSLSAHDEWAYFAADELASLALAPFDGPALAAWAAGTAGGQAGPRGAQKE